MQVYQFGNPDASVVLIEPIHVPDGMEHEASLIREQAGMDVMLQKTLSWADMDQPIFIDGVGTVETIVKIASIAGADWYYHLATPFAYG